MVTRITTVAFQGIEPIPVDVQVQTVSGLPSFQIVGLPDKAVAESKERVRAALYAIGLALPAERITVNLSPADLQKEGSHFDLPIALGILGCVGALPSQELARFMALGELALDGRLTSVSGVLPAALQAASQNLDFICPEVCGGEAAWAQDIDILPAPTLLSIVNHFKGSHILTRPSAKMAETNKNHLDLFDIKGQEGAKRALEVAAAGGHNLLMQGPPGSGKSMLAARLPGLLPPLEPHEALEVTMIHSISGNLPGGQLLRDRPYRDPHHSASLPSLVGGGHKALPGEVTLAHLGVLFLDEIPEFSRNALESLRQPLETGQVTVARANAHMTYPARFQLIAAMNPCRCGHMDDASRACAKAPRCGTDYQNRLSGPFLDRIDINIQVPALEIKDLGTLHGGEGSAIVADRILRARHIQQGRYDGYNLKPNERLNAHIPPNLLEEVGAPDTDARSLLNQAAEVFKLSARGYHRLLRVARTVADLAGAPGVRKTHMAEALSLRTQLLAF